MSDLIEQFKDLAAEVDQALSQINAEQTEQKIAKITENIQAPDFWKDREAAQAESIRLAKLKAEIAPWQELKHQVQEALELSTTKDDSLSTDLQRIYTEAKGRYDELKAELLFNGQYDRYNVLLSIYSGAGGTDAQDWAEMLLRMYLRWAESTGYKINIIEQSAGLEAGIKNATIEVDGPMAFGRLKGEHGVHRLVRLSPFNADHLRQTSFAKVEVLPKIDKPEEVEIDENDLKIDVYRAGGHGGQSVNTTDSAVRVTHLPTNISVAIQNERSQLQNRETAMTILRSRLIQLQLEQHQDKISELKGPNEQVAWGNQIRSYVLHPYNLVKDLRTGYETSDPQAVLSGKINGFIAAYLNWSVDKNSD
jgi:peptide chain release factor 2